LFDVRDTAGQERFHQGTIGQSFYRGSNGCVLVYDVTNESSLEQLLSWRDEAIARVDPDYFFPIVVVGNKLDLKTEANAVDQLTILNWCRENTYGHIETSAKDGTGIEAAMQTVVLLALEAMRNRSPQAGADKSTKEKQGTIRLEDMYSPSKRSACNVCP